MIDPFESKILSAGLYIVATPIGNLSDISERAIYILRHADLVAVEDSRVSGKLLHHLGLKKKMRPYHDHSDDRVRQDILNIARNHVVALISDAGTPLISDPGYKLVRDARAANIMVTTAPGPNSAIAALTISGLPTDRFYFYGFLPNKKKARCDALSDIKNINATLIFFENGARLAASIADIYDQLGNREIVIAREISKKFEEVISGSYSEIQERLANNPPKGEIVLMVGPPDEQGPEQGDIRAALAEALDRLPAGKAAAEISKRFGVERKDMFDLSAEIRAAKIKSEAS
ncbi:16S rRNA (cytidine(1402)-2'-O)-methyltransferase [Sphingorhabdus lutea]|uniref:Ribosomal RNA small subunit methyltransferase I n=1 Tax=Sphingorhabdus lutea TaxID=1913578 RepID=A0A1L3JBF1_9SPHN|nr:16S rRNA (cytidine(1402)-2'-O)-methyltransferase [Sphingorhabdus lutea]APG62461.1 16S rRNA (cytidine(1402)-2'-O)-methyltransferase [Sphingorhabdus lutea]